MKRVNCLDFVNFGGERIRGVSILLFLENEEKYPSDCAGVGDMGFGQLL